MREIDKNLNFPHGGYLSFADDQRAIYLSSFAMKYIESVCFRIDLNLRSASLRHNAQGLNLLPRSDFIALKNLLIRQRL